MKKDKGSIHKLFSMLLLWWIVICFCVGLGLTKAGYVNQYLEDVLMQANLSAILIDPYHYGATGELVFADTEYIETVFEKSLTEALGENTNYRKLGIYGPIQILEIRLYEVIEKTILEVAYVGDAKASVLHYEKGETVIAPDGTNIESSAIYVRIAVPLEVVFGIRLTAIKEHCVDVVVSEEGIYG